MKYIGKIAVVSTTLILLFSFVVVVSKTQEFNSDADNISPRVKNTKSKLDFLEIPEQRELGVDYEASREYFIGPTNTFYNEGDFKSGLYTIEFAYSNGYCFSSELVYLINDSKRININFCDNANPKLSTNQMLNVYVSPELSLNINEIFKYKKDGSWKKTIIESNYHNKFRTNINFIAQEQISELDLAHPKPGIYPVDSGTYNIEADAYSTYYVIDDDHLKVYDPQIIDLEIDPEIERIPENYKLVAEQGDKIIVVNSGLSISRI